jgi:hypothetical protein
LSLWNKYHSKHLCGALNHQNLIEMAQGHISLSEEQPYSGMTNGMVI